MLVGSTMNQLISLGLFSSVFTIRVKREFWWCFSHVISHRLVLDLRRGRICSVNQMAIRRHLSGYHGLRTPFPFLSIIITISTITTLAMQKSPKVPTCHGCSIESNLSPSANLAHPLKRLTKSQPVLVTIRFGSIQRFVVFKSNRKPTLGGSVRFRFQIDNSNFK